MAGMAVRAEGLGKRYGVRAAAAVPYHTLRDDLVQMLGGRLRRSEQRRSEIQALQDVSFELEAGERVGIIGRNGAGKSTLLKILSRVTAPSEGRAYVAGSVGAMLEVGTGFHPELTGRENVYLSGTILGMKRPEIARRFDEIVEFAELRDLIDTPVKRYSSGMYARLGFAVAAHLRPAILMVDEVLAVGDLAFQAKSYARMRGLADEGVAILLVSHNLLSVADFCSRVMLLESGRLMADGAPDTVIRQYRRALTQRSAGSGSGDTLGPLFHNGLAVGDAIQCVAHEPVSLAVEANVPTNTRGVILNLVVETASGQQAMHLRSDNQPDQLDLVAGRNRLTIHIDSLTLGPGDYWAYIRLVSLDPRSGFVRDTERIFMEVQGAATTQSIAWPRVAFTAQAIDR